MPITLDTIAIPSPDVLFQNLSGESILLNLANESYFGLNPVGTRVWELLGPDRPLRKVFEELVSEYAVEGDRLAADLLVLVEQLVDADLVKLSPE